jgi:hypothetical protein
MIYPKKISEKIEPLIKHESVELETGFSFTDHFTSWNIASGILNHYFNKYFPGNDHLIDPIIDVTHNQSPENKAKPNEPENIALVGEKNIT